MVELKKNPKKDLRPKSFMFFNIGLIIALLLTISAFEYKVYDHGSEIDLKSTTELFDELVDIPQTIQPPPPKPVIQQPDIVEVTDEEEIIEDIEINLDIEMTEETVIEDVILTDAPPEEDPDEIFTIVEEQPTPYKGISAWYKYVNKELKYPKQAQRMGVEGRVFVNFVVEKDGSITDIQILKDPGAGLGDETRRILEEYPHKWNPGKQRGNPVRVRFSWSLNFQLN